MMDFFSFPLPSCGHNSVYSLNFENYILTLESTDLACVIYSSQVSSVQFNDICHLRKFPLQKQSRFTMQEVQSVFGSITFYSKIILCNYILIRESRAMLEFFQYTKGWYLQIFQQKMVLTACFIGNLWIFIKGIPWFVEKFQCSSALPNLKCAENVRFVLFRKNSNEKVHTACLLQVSETTNVIKSSCGQAKGMKRNKKNNHLWD